MDKGQAIDKMIVFLARPENRNKEHNFDQVSNLLDIPKDVAKMCFNTMFYSRRYIDGPPSIKTSVIRITEQGLKYAHEMESEHYKETGKLLFSVYAEPLPLPEVCERLFQMHRNNDFRVVWTKETFKGQPENLVVAKEVLIRENVIYLKTNRTETTYLNPELFEVKSYLEAKRILKGDSVVLETEKDGYSFTSAERVDISNKIDEVLQKLNELGLGQEILFEELEELKSLNLNKKNWTQLLKGKLLDLMGKEILNKKTAIAIYEIISQSIKADRLILP